MASGNDFSRPAADLACGGSAAGGSAAGTWGEGLAYPESVLRFLPALHDGFIAVNRMPLTRVRATGVAAGPENLGGRYWVVPLATGAVPGPGLAAGRGRRSEKA
jgi:hypothetical protein